jgi:hypothetical protein
MTRRYPLREWGQRDEPFHLFKAFVDQDWHERLEARKRKRAAS